MVGQSIVASSMALHGRKAELVSEQTCVINQTLICPSAESFWEHANAKRAIITG
jgi:hypothetical protein